MTTVDHTPGNRVMRDRGMGSYTSRKAEKPSTAGEIKPTKRGVSFFLRYILGILRCRFTFTRFFFF